MTKSKGKHILHVYGTAEAKFWAKVDKRGPDECWSWRASKYASGYGQFAPGGSRRVAAHRFAYELLVGPIPDGMDLDHQCHNRDLSCPGGTMCPHRACCNPAHVEPATRRVNLSRGRTNMAKTHCVHGHEYTPENTYRWRNQRHCRICQKQR